MHVFTNSIVPLLFSKTAYSMILPQSRISFTEDFYHLVNAWFGPRNVFYFCCRKSYLSLEFRPLDNSATSSLNNKASFRVYRCRIFEWKPLARLAFSNVSNALVKLGVPVKPTLIPNKAIWHCKFSRMCCFKIVSHIFIFTCLGRC